MRRRVGSASAAKVRFKVVEYLTIWLTIKRGRQILQVKNFLGKTQPRPTLLKLGQFNVAGKANDTISLAAR